MKHLIKELKLIKRSEPILIKEEVGNNATKVFLFDF